MGRRAARTVFTSLLGAKGQPLSEDHFRDRQREQLAYGEMRNSIFYLSRRFTIDNGQFDLRAKAVGFLLNGRAAVFSIGPIRVAFAIACRRITVVRRQEDRRTVRRVTLYPRHGTTVGNRHRRPIVLVSRVSTVTISSRVVRQARFTFPRGLAATRVGHHRIAVVNRHRGGTIGGSKDHIGVTRAIGFNEANHLKGALLPGRLTLFRRRYTSTAVVTARSNHAGDHYQHELTARERQERVRIGYPFSDTIDFIRHLWLAIANISWRRAITSRQTQGYFAHSFDLPYRDAVTNVRHMGLHLFTTGMSVPAERNRATEGWYELFERPTVFLNRTSEPSFFTVVHVRHFCWADTIHYVSGIIHRYQVGVKVRITGTTAGKDTPHHNQHGLIFGN